MNMMVPKGGAMVTKSQTIIISVHIILSMVMTGFIKLPAHAEVFSAEPISTNSPQQKKDALFSVEVISEESLKSTGKRVLIYHTHTYEAYEQSTLDPYQQTEKWRTTDNEHNMVAVGKTLAAHLRVLGIEVVHDTTAFEPPNLDTAYERSLAMLERRQANGEKYDLYLDLHRDALASSSTIKRTVNIGGEEIARLMVLVGKGTAGGYDKKPNWEDNLVLAQQITDTLNSYCPQLSRDVKIKTGRFNQHISTGCLLIECGLNYNTIHEVLAAMPYLADAISQTLRK